MFLNVVFFAASIFRPRVLQNGVLEIFPRFTGHFRRWECVVLSNPLTSFLLKQTRLRPLLINEES